MKTVKCDKCCWVHFVMSRQEAENSVKQFNDYYDTLSIEKQNDYYGGHKSSITNYEYCFRCNNHYKNFIPANNSDCPIGSTLQPIIDPSQ